MINKHKAFIISVLNSNIGDDSSRARAVFRNHTPEEMQEVYGNSGKSKAQVLAEYEAQDEKYRAAIDWLRTR